MRGPNISSGTAPYILWESMSPVPVVPSSHPVVHHNTASGQMDALHINCIIIVDVSGYFGIEMKIMMCLLGIISE